MFSQSKKNKEWKSKDYVLSILQFVIHAIIMLVLLGVGLIVYTGSFNGCINYVVGKETYMKVIYAAVAIILLAFVTYMYFYYEFRDFLTRAKNIAVVFISIELAYLGCLFIGNYVAIFARPVALCALLLLLLVNSRTAIFINVIFCSFMLVGDLFLSNGAFAVELAMGEFVVSIATGHLAVYLVENVGSRIKVFGMGFIISLPMVVVAFLYNLQLAISDVYAALWVILNGFMAGLFSVCGLIVVLPFFEAVFNFLTNYRLAEITDHKSKLVKKMIEEAGGTFQHSLLVSTLAESCATAIGENPLLARAAAYYHDMGKLKQPMYFTENQHGYNPHDDLTPELSTQIIRSHTTDGYDLIKKYHLPLILADVANEHHGTLPIQYFYNKALKFTDGDLDIKDYSYPGPKPTTKIAAIIMLADGCEAAVRAQNDRSREKVEKVVSAIVEDRMKLDQFSDCEITMREIDIIKNTLEDSLSGVYHDRIKYPKMTNKSVNAFEAAPKETAKKGKKSRKSEDD